MASMEESLRDAGDLLSCAICLEDFDDPRILPCGHTFCFKCLQNHVERTGHDNRIHCPVCREMATIPTGEAFAKNYVLAQIKDDQARKDHRCAHWQPDDPHEDAVCFCTDCGDYYCPVCRKSHKQFRQMADHRVVGLDELRPEQVKDARAHLEVPRCDKHPHEKITIFCKSCSVPVCTVCTTIGHEGHKKESLADAAKKSKAGLKSATDSASQYCKHLAAMKSASIEEKNKLDRDCRAAIKQAERATKVIKDRADAQLANLKANITDFQKNAKDAILDSVEHYDTQTGKVGSLVSVSEALVTDYNHTTQDPGIKKKLGGTEREPLESVKCKSELENVPCSTLEAGELVGRVATKKVITSNIDVSQESTRTFQLQQKSSTYGMAMLFGLLHVIQSDSSSVDVYRAEGRLKKKITVPGLSRPCGLAIVDEDAGKIAVTDSDNNMVCLLTLTEDHIITESRPIKLNFTPCDISMDASSGLLLLAGKNPARITTATTSGQVIINTIIQLPAIKSARTVLTTKHGFVVADWNGKKVVWVEQTGRISKSYTGKDASTLLGSVEAVIQDDNGHILVCDKDNHEIHLLTPDGTFIKCLISPQTHDIKYPTCLYLDDKNRHLYVGHSTFRNYKVSVFRYGGREDGQQSMPPAAAVTTTYFRLKVRLNEI